MANPKIIDVVGGGVGSPPPPPVFTDLVIGNDTFKINDKGEAVDETGKVVKTKDELEVLKKGTGGAGQETEAQKTARETAEKLAEKTKEVEKQLIEDAEVELLDDKGVIIKYKLDKDGNVVDATNKVIKTKAEVTAILLAQEEESSDVDYVKEIQKTTNLTIIDTNNQPIIYENTLPGITQYVQDVHKEGRKLGAEEYESNLFGRFPILNDIIEHLTINGSLKDFTENVDYSKITLGDDESQYIDIFTKAKLAQGLSQSEITDMVNYYKADKKLKSAAEAGLTYLKTEQTNAITQRAADVAKIKADEEAGRTAYWNEVNKALTSKQLLVGDKKFIIPEVIKIKDNEGKIVSRTIKDFQDYIQKPLTFRINNQNYTMTQLEYDEAVEDTKRTPHNDLFDAYRRFTKYDDSQIIAANASDAIVKKVIKLTTKAGGGGSGAAGKGGKLVLPIN